MVTTQVVMEFARRSPADEQTLDALADATLSALNRDTRFIASGPVVSVNYPRSVIEVECTIHTDSADDAEIDRKVEHVGEVVRNALAVADYTTSTERIAAPA